MRHCSIVFFLAALIASSCNTAVKETECSSKKRLASTLNATELFNASTICWREDEKDMSAYFLTLGQIRASADMTLYSPTKEGKEKAAELYSKLYYQFGGVGDDAIFRDAARYNALIKKIENTPLLNNNGYSPGWDYKTKSKVGLYSQFLNSSKKSRLWQLENYKRNLSNDVYFEAHIAANQLRAENSTFKVGAEAYEEYQKLNEIKRQASLSIEKLPKPEDNAPYHLLIEIDQHANFKQLDTNFNGPEKGQIELFESLNEVLKSWVSRSYEVGELEDILKQVNFENDVLMVLSIGKMTNHSGRIVLNTFEKKERGDSYVVGVNVGVIPSKCGEATNESFPFILATAPRTGDIKVTSRSRSNFPDKCSVVVSGTVVARD